MSNETKRNVFLQIAKENRDLRMYDPEAIEPKELIEQDYQDWIRDYDTALPDNLPVIPKAVGVSIKEQKAKQSLGGALFDAIFAANELGRKNVGPVVNWMVDNDETYANAWLTGVWRVEETGEIVKLEMEKWQNLRVE